MKLNPISFKSVFEEKSKEPLHGMYYYVIDIWNKLIKENFNISTESSIISKDDIVTHFLSIIPEEVKRYSTNEIYEYLADQGYLNVDSLNYVYKKAGWSVFYTNHKIKFKRKQEYNY